jgi:Ca2+-binding RTX toxin-like protein
MGPIRRFAGLLGALALACCAPGGVAIALESSGSTHGERLVGTKGDDVLEGGGGNDVLIGGRGRDLLIGGRGIDVLRGGGGHDGFNMKHGVQIAAPGRDRIYARDGVPDEINCGAGRDLAVVDAVEDGVYDCEVVREP